MLYGETLELHPATDRWMRGDRFGVVVNLLPKKDAVVLKMNRSRRRVTVHLENLMPCPAVERLRQGFAGKAAE